MCSKRNKISLLQNIPQPRGNSAEWAIGFLSVLIILFGSYYSKRNRLLYIITTLIVYILIKLTDELLYKDAFSFSDPTKWLFIVTLLIFISMLFMYGNIFEIAFDCGYISNMCSCLGVLLFSRLLKLNYGSLHQSLNLTELNGLDYGTAMAYSFFHGFLEIVLPHRGNDRKGIKELMQDFESKEGIKFNYYKLLVLIPLSLHCPVSVADKSSIMELGKSLPEIRVTRAGVRDRIYKNTLYKIKKSTKYVYVCAEYATPLQTLYDIVSRSYQHSNHYKKQSKELALQFYLTLQGILNEDPDCGNFCDLIFFDDKNEDGGYVDVGEVLLAHLKRQERLSKKNC